ncbi:MAG: molybdopterin-guanine dinucleotide biosynthesis protein B [Desulfobacterales bacterium]|nr:molybdopterin-guanine dinucleotide biosynthesis protein B [Desulfobacterales bacterium]
MTAPVHIIGQPGSGKTTLVANLVRNLTERGLAVGTLKHSSHAHELDKPGKDSHIHRTAGASPAAMVTSRMAAIYMPVSDDTAPDKLIETYYRNANIVLIEGWISGPYPKIEIWRAAVERPPLFGGLDDVTALATDDLPGQTEDALAKSRNITRLGLEPISAIADLVIDLSNA